MSDPLSVVRSSSLLPLLLAATLGGACGSSSTEAPASSSTPAPAPSRTAAMTRSSFGTLPGGQAVEAFTLTNAHGMEVKAITLGGIITSLKVPDKAGQLGDVVLGFDTLRGLPRQVTLLRHDRRSLRQPHRQGRRSRSTARSTRCRSTTARTTCTAARRASTRPTGRPSPSSAVTPWASCSRTPAPTATWATRARCRPRSPTP